MQKGLLESIFICIFHACSSVTPEDRPMLALKEMIAHGVRNCRDDKWYQDIHKDHFKPIYISNWID